MGIARHNSGFLVAKQQHIAEHDRTIRENLFCCGLWFFGHTRRLPEASAQDFNPPPLFSLVLSSLQAEKHGNVGPSGRLTYHG